MFVSNFFPGQLFFHDHDQLVVEDKDESATNASEDVGEVALEECAVTLILKLVIIFFIYLSRKYVILCLIFLIL
jgi:hypothetical protein